MSSIIHLNTTFRNTEATDALRNYAEEKVTNCLKKFVQKDIEAHIILKVEKKRQIVEITFNTWGESFKNTEESDDMYKSVDQLVDSLSNQLRKFKQKKIKHN